MRQNKVFLGTFWFKTGIQAAQKDGKANAHVISSHLACCMGNLVCNNDHFQANSLRANAKVIKLAARALSRFFRERALQSPVGTWTFVLFASMIEVFSTESSIKAYV